MLLSILSGLNVQTVLIGVIVILVVYKLRYRLKYKLPPGPFSIPIIGTYEVFGATFLHELFGKYKKQYGPVFKIEFGPVPVIVLNDIDSVTEALVKRKADFANRPDVHSFKVLSEGAKDIAFANYTPTWKLHRKLALKALRQYLAGEQLEKVMHASLEKCLPEMAKETGPFNPEPIIDLIMFNILDAVCFGESVVLDDPEFCRFMKLNKDAQELVGNGFIEDMFPLMYKVWTTKKYRTVVRWFDELFLYIRKKIEEHQKTFDPNHTRDLVDSMLLAKYEVSQDDNEELASQMTDTHVRQTIADIFFAGIDTSRITMYFAVRYMAGLPDIQVKVQEEIDRVVGKDQLPGLEHRDSLSYTEATLYEVMRMGNSLPLGLPHATLCDTQVGGYDVPQGTTVMINHWALHYDSKYWPDADKFEPTRYLDQNGKLGMKPESWLPFSAGRRVCLGETVAKPELHLIFASLMQRFSFSLPEGVSSEVKLEGGSSQVKPASFEVIVKERK